MDSHYFSRGGQPRPGGTARLLQLDWRGRRLQLATAPGVFSKSRLDAGSRLLMQTAQWPPGSAVCDLGCGWGAVGCTAATDAGCRVWMGDINLAAATAARDNLRRNDLHNGTVWCGDGLSAVRSDVFDVILFNPPVRAGNAALEQLFADCRRCLKSGGRLWLVLRTAQGAKSWQKRLAELFGVCDTMEVDAGYRVFACLKS